MAWTHIQGAGANAALGTGVGVAFGTNLSSGSKEIAYVAASVAGTTFPATTAVSDGTNSFTKIADSTYQDTTDNVAFELSVWVLDTPSGKVGTKPTITATISNITASAGCGIMIQEVSGLQAGSSCIDGSVAFKGWNTGSGTSIAFPTYSSTAASEYLVQIYSDFGSSNPVNLPTGYTSPMDTNGTNGNTEMAIAWKNSTGAAETGNWTGGYLNSNAGLFGAVAFLLPGKMAGGLAAISSLSGTLAGSGPGSMAGGLSASSALSGTLNAGGAIAGGVSASSAVAGTLSVSGPIHLTGAVAATTTLTGTLLSNQFATGVSSDGRSIVDQNGDPYLVNGDTPWNLAWGLNATDQAFYLSTRASEGFNSVMVDLVGNNQMSGNANGANWNGEVPFTGGVFSNPNSTYWARIDTFFQLCEQYGITAWALPVDAYAASSGNLFASATTTDATSIGTFLGNRYKSYPNIVWMIGNDYSADGPSGSSVNTAPTPTFYVDMLSAIATAGDTHLTTSELGYYESNSSDGSLTWSHMTVQGVYCYHPTYEGVLRGRTATPTKPAVVVEVVYENPTTAFPGTALDLRKTVLWPLTSGAGGQFYGNDGLWRLTVEPNTSWKALMPTTDVTIRNTLFQVVAGLAWQNLTPDTTSALVTSGRQTQWTSGPDPSSQSPFTNDSTYGEYVTAAYTADGTLAVIYTPGNNVSGITPAPTITLATTVLGANPTLTRVDPTNGAQTHLTWSTTITSPGNNAAGDPDWLYIITATNQHLVGSINATSALSAGNPTITQPLVGPVAATTQLSGSFGQQAAFAGAVTSRSTVSGTLSVTQPLTGAVAASSSLGANMSAAEALAGPVAASSALTGTLLDLDLLAGVIADTSALSGTLGLAGAGALGGHLLATSALTGTLTGAQAVAGSISSTSALTGTLVYAEAFVGAMVAEAALQATLGILDPITGTVASASTVAGVLGQQGAGALAGSLNIMSALAGSLGGVQVLNGTVAAAATLSGFLTVTGPAHLAGSISVASALNANLAGGFHPAITVQTQTRVTTVETQAP